MSSLGTVFFGLSPVPWGDVVGLFPNAALFLLGHLFGLGIGGSVLWGRHVRPGVAGADHSVVEGVLDSAPCWGYKRYGASVLVGAGSVDPDLLAGASHFSEVLGGFGAASLVGFGCVYAVEAEPFLLR